jgi:hypothetical protein
MESLAHSPAPARSLRGRALRATRPPRPLALFALGVALFLLGCGAGQGERRVPALSTLVAGKRAAPIPPAQLARAAEVARRFAGSYARSIYRRKPRPLPGATAKIDRELAAATSRIPPGRHHLSPRSAGLQLSIAAADRLEANVLIVDGRSPRFSVGFTVSRQGNGWRVSSISAPE